MLVPESFIGVPSMIISNGCIKKKLQSGPCPKPTGSALATAHLVTVMGTRVFAEEH